MRNLEEEVIAALRQRAEKAGLSMEETIRRILREAVAGERVGLGTRTAEVFSGSWDGERLALPEREDAGAPDFSGA